MKYFAIAVEMPWTRKRFFRRPQLIYRRNSTWYENNQKQKKGTNFPFFFFWTSHLLTHFLQSQVSKYEKIADGGFSSVFLGTYKNEKVAIKEAWVTSSKNKEKDVGDGSLDVYHQWFMEVFVSRYGTSPTKTSEGPSVVKGGDDE